MESNAPLTVVTKELRAANDRLEASLLRPARAASIVLTCIACGRDRQPGHTHCGRCKRGRGGR